MIRGVRPTDAVALLAFVAPAGTAEITAPTWLRVQSEGTWLARLRLLAHALSHPAARQRAWLSLSDGCVQGLAIAQVRAGGLVWHVDRLLAAEAAERTATDLLDYVAARAASAAARRIFFDAPSDSGGMDIARRAGFGRYTSSVLYAMSAPFPVERATACDARRRRRADGQPLFQLYNAAVPLPVRMAEAMTYEEWAPLHPAHPRWASALASGQEQYVWELGDSPVACMEVSHGWRSQHLAFLTHPTYDEAADKLVHFGVSQASGRSSIYVSARDYQQALRSALERAGFQAVSASDCFVRLLVGRVVEPRLVPAKIVGGC